MSSIFAISLLLLNLTFLSSFVLSPGSSSYGWMSKLKCSDVQSPPSPSVAKVQYDDIILFLKEHIQKTDQMCLLGAQDDLALRLALDGYGQKKTGYVLVLSDNQQHIEEHLTIAQADPLLSTLISSQKLQYRHVESYAKLKGICKQSVFDSIVDNQALDTLVNKQEAALTCLDHLQNSLRIGNILVCLSKQGKEVYANLFQQKFGWVQELDGEPGEVSAWYRGKIQVEAKESKFGDLGLKMYVYTNTFNC